MKFNPYAREIKFAQSVNKASGHGVKFFVYRTVDGSVVKCEIKVMTVNLQCGTLEASFMQGEEYCHEEMTKLDLQLISQQARQYERTTV